MSINFLSLIGCSGVTAASGPSVRNVSTGITSSGTSSLTLPTRSSGDSLVVYTASANDPPTANTGWTRRFLRPPGVDLMGGLALYTRQSDGTDNTPFSGNVGGDTGYVAISVQGGSSGYITSGSGAGSSSTSVVAPSVTAIEQGSMFLLSGYLVSNGSATLTVPGGQTPTTAVQPPVAIPSMTLRVGYESFTSNSPADTTGTRTATSSASANWAAATALLK